jgi:hypothetical protein
MLLAKTIAQETPMKPKKAAGALYESSSPISINIFLGSRDLKILFIV